MRYEQIRPRMLIAEVVDKSNQKLTLQVAHLSDQVEERKRQWRMLLQRSSSVTRHILTLCDDNSLLFPAAEALQLAMGDSPAVLVSRNLEFQWLRNTQLQECWLQVHTPPDRRDKLFESPSGWTWGFSGQFNELVLESGRERHIDKILSTTWLSNAVTSIYPKRVGNEADHLMVLATFSPPVTIEGRHPYRMQFTS